MEAYERARFARPGLEALHPLQRVLPQRRLVAPQPELRLEQPRRVGEQPGPELEEGAPDHLGVGDRIGGLVGGLGLLAPEFLGNLLTALRELAQPLAQDGLLTIARFAHGPASRTGQGIAGGPAVQPPMAQG